MLVQMTPGLVDLAASQLVGRDTEVARVDAMLERLAEGGAALVVSGEAGSGSRRCWTMRALERMASVSGR
jgi:hypothetical protein